MIGALRLLVFGFLGLSVIYFIVAIYARSTEKERLEKEWEEEVGTGDRDEYVRRGLAEYRHSLRRKLIWLVYILPMLAIAVLLYVINFM